jgi:hypothetical protein
MRSLCYKRPFGIKSDSNSVFPEVQDFEMISYAEPEYRFNVIMPNDDKFQVIVSNTKLMTTQKEVLNLIWQQTGTMFEPLKPKDFRAKLNEWRRNGQKIKPPKGTQLEDRLEEELYQYCINGPQAQERNQIQNGSCFTEEGFHYFRFNSFLEHLGSSWKIPEEKIAQKLKDRCFVEFDHSLNVDGKTLKVCKVKQLHVHKIEYKPVERKGTNY